MVKVKHERHIAWAHFVHLGALKIHLLPSLETHVQGYVASCELIFFILATWKCDFCLVVKPMLQGYVASCKHIFPLWRPENVSFFKVKVQRPCEKTKFAARVKSQRSTFYTNDTSHVLTSCILAPWKYIYCWVLKLTFKGTGLRAYSFWRLENAIFAESWNPCYKSS